MDLYAMEHDVMGRWQVRTAPSHIEGERVAVFEGLVSGEDGNYIVTPEAMARLFAASGELLKSLEDVIAAWLSEANDGDGIREENGPVLDAARSAIQAAK